MATRKKKAAPKPRVPAKKKAAPKKRPPLPHAHTAIAAGFGGIPSGGIKVHQRIERPKRIGRHPRAVALVWRDGEPDNIYAALKDGYGEAIHVPHLAVDPDGKVVQYLVIGKNGAFVERQDMARTVVIGRIGKNAKPTTKQRMIADMLIHVLQRELRIPKIVDQWPEV